MASPTRSAAMANNMDVDYVIVYRYVDTDRAKAEQSFERLMKSLATVGLATEVREGDNHSLLVFAKVASQDHFYGEVYRSRVQDWIHGIRSAAPEKEVKQALEADPLTEAERLRIIYQLITKPENEGGAGITPKKGQWENVESIFALHDHQYNKEWIKRWSTQWFLNAQDLDEIRDRLGAKIALYFAFTQSYFTFLIFPAAIGLLSFAFLGSFSTIYAIIISLWAIVFVEYWKHQEEDLAVHWNVKGVSSVETKRLDFEHEKEARDPITGETQHIFPATKRLQRQLLQLPFAIAAVIVLGTLIATAFGIEIFISEVYNGPFKSVLVFLPTVILTTGLPLLTGLLTNAATRLSDYENYETDSAYERSMTHKIFVLNFITSYLPILLTAFVYVPFGTIIVPYLDVFSLTVRPFAENEKQLQAPSSSKFEINPERLRKQVIYFTVTAQVVNLATEVVVPYLKRQGFVKYREMQSKKASNKGASAASSKAPIEDHAEEKEFLARVRSEAELNVYDVTADLREMVVQFGYLALFSCVWPLVPVSFLINNWVELRADAIKICVEMQRPVPWRADTIGPWLDALGFLTWVGSITMAALTYLFSDGGLGPDGSPSNIKGWALMLSIFFSEHIYLVVRQGVALAISKIDSPGLQKMRRERFLVRSQYFKDSLENMQIPSSLTDEVPEKISRQTLEEEARQSTLRTATQEERFWARQRNWKESAFVGKGLIERAPLQQVQESKKEL